MAMSTPTASLTIAYDVRTFNVDEHLRLTPTALSGMLLDAAGLHAHRLGVDIVQLEPVGITWVLSRFRVTVERWPSAGDRVEVTTWPSGIEKLAAYREFRFGDGNGTEYGNARSVWVMIDIKRRRPVHAEPWFERAGVVVPAHHPDDTVERLPELGIADPELEQRFTVRHSDIDMNGHVTSASYIAWALETVPYDLLLSGRLRELQIDYLAETFHHEDVTARARIETDGVMRHDIVRMADHRELARVRTLWRTTAG